jgi:hypothetical protein
MKQNTPTANSGRGFETLAGNLKPERNSASHQLQGNCAQCLAFDSRSPNFTGFGYCKRRSPAVDGEEFWPRVAPDNWCLDFVPRGREATN